MYFYYDIIPLFSASLKLYESSFWPLYRLSHPFTGSAAATDAGGTTSADAGLPGTATARYGS